MGVIADSRDGISFSVILVVCGYILYGQYLTLS
jgi:hypothetical protein